MPSLPNYYLHCRGASGAPPLGFGSDTPALAYLSLRTALREAADTFAAEPGSVYCEVRDGIGNVVATFGDPNP